MYDYLLHGLTNVMQVTLGMMIYFYIINPLRAKWKKTETCTRVGVELYECNCRDCIKLDLQREADNKFSYLIYTKSSTKPVDIINTTTVDEACKFGRVNHGADFNFARKFVNDSTSKRCEDCE